MPNNRSANGARFPAAMREFDEAGVPSYVIGGTRNNAARVMPMAPTGMSMGMPTLPGVSVFPSGTTSGLAGVGGGCAPAPMAQPVPETATGTGTGTGTSTGTGTGNWRQAGDDLRRLRSRHVVLIERMLRNHRPHDVLTQVPENYDWHSKTFQLAIKIERLMFTAATSRENYLNESTLRNRVQLLSRHLVRIRKRKNAMAAAAYETRI